MLGETVSVLKRIETGTDSMGEPIYQWQTKNVENVLVKPGLGENLTDDLRPDGIRVKYTLAFPKTFTDSLRGARIALIERNMSAEDYESALVVVGDPGITNPCPTSWNRIVEAGTVYG